MDQIQQSFVTNKIINQIPSFNQKVTCQKHNKLCTMVCVTHKCGDRLLCQECLLNHAHSHLSKVIPISEFNSQSNMIPCLMSKEIGQQKTRIYNLQSTIVTSKEKRKMEFKELLKQLNQIITQRFKSFEDEGIQFIEQHFSQYFQLISEHLYTITQHLETLAPYIYESKTVDSTKINFLLQYQEKMMNDVLPQMEISVNNLSQQILQLDLFIKKDNYLKNFFFNLDPLFKQKDLFTDKNPFDSKNLVIQRNKTLQSTSSLVLQNLPTISQTTKQQNISGVSLPFSQVFGSPLVNKECRGHNDIVTHICLVDYQKFLSCSGDYSLKMWDIDQGNCLGTLKGHLQDVWAALMLSNTYVASCSSDKSIKIWNLDDWGCVCTLLGHSDIVYCLAYNQKTKRMFSGSADTTIKQWNIEGRLCEKTIQIHSKLIKQIAILCNFDMILTCSSDKTCKVYNCEKNYCNGGFQGHKSEVNAIVEIEPQDNDILVASGDSQGYIMIWNAFQGQKLKEIKAHNGLITCLIYSKNINLLISSSTDHIIKCWRSGNFTLDNKFQIHNKAISHFQYHYSRNVLITAGWDKLIKIFFLQVKETGNQYLKQFVTQE